MTNEIIAEQVMGWEVIKYDNGIKDIVFPDGEVRKLGSVGNYFDFLNDMNAAMMVVEKMRNNGYKISIADDLTYDKNFEGYVAAFYEEPHRNKAYRGESKSLPTAICTAAIKAIEGNQ